MFNATEFTDDYLVVPEQQTDEPPAKKTKKSADMVTSEKLENLEAEEMMHLVASAPFKFQGEALITLMKKAGIKGIGGNATSKLMKVNEVLSSLNIFYNDGNENTLALSDDLHTKINAEVPPWVVDHASAFADESSARISSAMELRSPDLEKMRSDFFARWGVDLVKFYRRTTLSGMPS
jgi:hypothetical protein